MLANLTIATSPKQKSVKRPPGDGCNRGLRRPFGYEGPLWRARRSGNSLRATQGGDVIRRRYRGLSEQGRHRVLRLTGKGQSTKAALAPPNAALSHAVD